MQKSNETIFPSFFSILTADIRYNKELTANEKILYSEITALTNAKGYCTATNNYFSKIYNVEPRTIQRWLINLRAQGFIKVKVKGNIRHIYIILPSETKKQKKKNKNPEWLNDYIDSFEKNVEDL